MIMLQNVCGFWKKRREAPPAPYVRDLMEKVKETGIFIYKPKREKSETVRAPKNIAAVAESVFVKRHQHQFTIVLNNWAFRKHHWDEFCIKVQLVQELNPIYHPMRFRLAKWAIDLQKMPILAKIKIIFSDKAHFDLGGYVNKQNCRIWGTENPHAYNEKTTHPKRVTIWCGFWFKGIS